MPKETQVQVDFDSIEKSRTTCSTSAEQPIPSPSSAMHRTHTPPKGHVVNFVEKEPELRQHDQPRSFKLKRGDEHFANPEQQRQSTSLADRITGGVSALSPPSAQRDAPSPGPSTTSSKGSTLSPLLSVDNINEVEILSAENVGSPHVAFDAPEDILHPHERSRSAQLKMADEIYVASEAPGSPHVVFAEPEKVLREHELSRLPMYKKGDERILNREGSVYTVEVAPYRVLFNTPEDLLQAHESPRAPALKLADEAYVRALGQTFESASSDLIGDPNNAMPSSISDTELVSPSKFAESSSGVNASGSGIHDGGPETADGSPRFGIDGKTPIIQLWHTNLIAAGLRTIAQACPITEVEREQRVTSVERMFHHLKGREGSPNAGFVALDMFQRVILSHPDLKAVKQAISVLLSDVENALKTAHRPNVLKLEDFTALFLTVTALFEQNDFRTFLKEAENQMLDASAMAHAVESGGRDSMQIDESGTGRKRPASPTTTPQQPHTSMPRHSGATTCLSF